jgi:hypothetical protein
MRELLVIVPSRGRPQNIVRLWDAWTATSRGAGALVVVIDADDPARLEYEIVCRERRIVAGVCSSAGGSGMVAALNEAALAATKRPYEALGFLGDDHRPRTPGWDERFLAELRRLGTGLVYGNDLLQGEAMPTAVAMTADIVRALGYMAPPALGHLNVDIAWLRWGKAVDRIVYLDDVVIEHVHPAAGKVPLDAEYERVNSITQVAFDGHAWDLYVHETLEADVEKIRALL